MTHGRKPRTPRTRVQNPVRLAAWQAALLDSNQVESIMTPLRLAFAALREGVGTELEWAYIVSAMNIADSVAITSPIRGTRGHIEPAQRALDGIMRRAMTTGEWCPIELYLEELDLIRDGLAIYHHQLQHLTRGEYQHAEDHAAADVRRAAGAVVINTNRASEQLALAGV
ncbi:hypothetical protein [Acidovorax sp. sic0104]|uniref:hypothetical protein n=1 Tax=Acidovorax sp. sic0104 TaxID=2854784 RepID=UPI001C459035|nr:hypothetical protein [Acidovorax sp. sic0104]MBV7541030.1 hypothetical protein [Acidovorax sp. sic0104]